MKAIVHSLKKTNKLPQTFVFKFSIMFSVHISPAFTQIQPTIIKIKLVIGPAGYSIYPQKFFKPTRVIFVEGGAWVKGEQLLLAWKETPHLEKLLHFQGASVLVCILQSHDCEGSSCQFLINKEHESSSEDCLQQFGFKAFVQSYYSKTPYSLVKKIENISKTPQCSVFWI